jgi:hypothetical protein
MTPFVVVAGHRGVHQEGIRQEVQPDVALHRRSEFRIVRDPRDPSLHILLSRTGGDTAVQERLINHSHPYSIPRKIIT